MPGGAPDGNSNAAKGRRWQAAIDRALAKRSRAAGIEELDRLAEVFLQAAEDMTIGTDKRGPSVGGFSELADRMDGKAQQGVTLSGELEVGIKKIEQAIVDPRESQVVGDFAEIMAQSAARDNEDKSKP